MVFRAPILIAILTALGATPTEARTWNSASGSIQIEADLIEKKEDGTIVLKRTDGATVETRPEKFSAADQEYIKQWKPVPNAKAGDPFEENGPAVETKDTLSNAEREALNKLQSSEVKSAVKAYEQRKKELTDAHAAKQQEYREKLAGLLEDALKEATTSGNLDDALAIRNAVKALRNGSGPAPPMKPQSAEVPRERPESKKKKDAEYPSGTWAITYTNGVRRVYEFSDKSIAFVEVVPIRGQMFYRDGQLLAEYTDGKMERLRLAGGNLLIEHWMSKADFATRPPYSTATGQQINK